jgi:hypothetical protein
MHIDAEVQQGRDEHVPGEATEDVEVKRLHDCPATILIWLAA